jgi:hypothetical protein
MRLIESITDQPNQSLTLMLEDGTKIAMTLVYKENQAGWFYSLSGGGLTVYNRRMVASPNLLRAFRDIITWGVACTTSDGYEPVFINDFSEGRAKFFLLNAEDVASVETQILPGFDER